jgi:hypothetical protein
MEFTPVATANSQTQRVVGFILFAIALVPTWMYLREWSTGQSLDWQPIAGPTGGLVLALGIIIGSRHRGPYYTCLGISVLMTAFAAYYTGH